jgi:membrane fusion protein (multidrug efflux system)
MKTSTSALRSPQLEEATLELPQRTDRSVRRRAWIFTILGIFAVIVVLVGVKAGQIATMINGGKHFVMPPESVTSAKVEQATWQASRTAVATLVAVHSVTISTEVTGTVRQIGFDSGATVKRGELLVRLDTSTEEAQLAAAEADAALAKVTLQRQKVLREQNSATPADLDAATSRAAQTEANVAQIRAMIAKKSIHAPFDGRLGIRQVELGQVLSAGNAIATLQSVTPILAEFWLPQQALSELRLGQTTNLHVDVYPGETWDGTITTINPEVDINSRNVRIRATFPNQDGRLRPGMFARAEIVSKEERTELIIPETAVIYAPFGDSVYSIEGEGKELKVKQKFVRLGERRGDLVAVLSGVKAGETIVSSGAFKLHNGSAVVIHNELAPAAEASPKPTDDK